jgi:hypothetical protein
MATVFLGVLHRRGANFKSDLRLFGGYAIPGIIVIALLVGRAVRRLPAFLR